MAPTTVTTASSEGEWRQLDKRVLLVTGAVVTGIAGGICLPVLLGLSSGAWFGNGPRRGIGLLLLLTAAVLLVLGSVAVQYATWRRTRYRIGPDRVDLHSGLLFVKRRSLARERIRSVDLTANPLLRVLGLVKVRIGTGESSGSGESSLVLDPVGRAEGERLRAELLDRPVDVPAAVAEGALAVLDPSWIRYAPTSFVAPALGVAAAGAVMQVSDFFGFQGEVIEWTGDRFHDTSVAVMVGTLVLAALVVGAIGALGLWVEMWWGYRLDREPGGVLRVRRGLFTTRSISVEERRLRGVELVEPLGVRPFGAARVDAVATGIADDKESDHADLQVLLPPAPRAVADSVVGLVLREPRTPMDTPLTPHPRAARARRLRWALLWAAAPAAVLVPLGLWLTSVLLYIAAGYAVVAFPVAVLLAVDAYRSLGHALSGGYLLTRSGSTARRTVALQRSGIIGWTISQSVFQRRSGLITVTATTAAGAGGYTVHDASEPAALALASEAVPGLLAPFLEPAPPGRADARR
ncbi:PH domain-containing protein [Streptomyces sp. NPDC048057]|uniref:PH domain-containing protein n=1 Tax=Streptomyces sp. NPDC048057 TaxID=3155628 RepID=UPI0033E4683A